MPSPSYRPGSSAASAAMVTGAVVDGDPLGPYELLAMLLCISGVALNLRPRPL